MEHTGSMTTIGDEYTELLNVWRPIAVYSEAPVSTTPIDPYRVYDVIHRLVNDARRYRTAMQMFEADYDSLLSQFNSLESSVDQAIHVLSQDINHSMDDVD